MGIELQKDGDTIKIDKNGLKVSGSLKVLSGRTKAEFKDEFSTIFKGLTDEVYTFVSKHGKKKPRTKKKPVETVETE